MYGQNLMNTDQPVNIMYVIVLAPRAGSNLATFQTAFSEEETITLVADITKQHVHFAHGNREPLEIERIFSVNRRGITSQHTIEFKHGRLRLTHIPEQRVERTRNKEVGGHLNDGEQTGNN